MRVRLSFVSVVLAVLIGATSLIALPGRVARAEGPFSIVSDTFFTFDVPNGSASVRLEAEVTPNGGRGLSEVWLYAMPGATEIRVTLNGVAAKFTTTPRLGDGDVLATVVSIPFAEPLKDKTRAKLTMTYISPPRSTKWVRFEPGAIGAFLVSQGPGSFVFFDLPTAAENVIEPGCVVINKQPREVRDAGLERWVCGETALAALSSDDKKTLQRCANLEDACRAQLEYHQAGFIQSITDQSKRAVKEAVVELERGPVKVTFRYFAREEAWASEVFPVAMEALPKLEKLFGFPYAFDTLLMRESYFIAAIGAAGVAFPSQGELLLLHTPGESAFNKEVAIHELAHQWAGHNLTRPWLWEGLAEYSTRSLALEMKIPLRDWGWEELGYKDPIATWYEGSTVTNSYYWYGKSGSFFLEFEKAVGGREKMTAVLAQMDDDKERLPLDGRWFMDTGEQVSGANLDELFLTWVFKRQSAEPVIKERRAAYEIIAPVAARVTEYGLKGWPRDMQANLNSWQFRPIISESARVERLLDAYVKLLSEAETNQLESGGMVTNIAAAWAEKTLQDLEALMQDFQKAIDAIGAASASLANQADGSPGAKQLADARAKFNAGDVSDAKVLAAGSTTVRFNKEAAEKMLALAKETQEGYIPTFFGKIGLMFLNPDKQLAAAETAYTAGDYASSLAESRAAFGAWEESSRNGVKRLAILSAVMSGFMVGGWYLLKRFGPKKGKRGVKRRFELGSGPSSGGDWREWENRS